MCYLTHAKSVAFIRISTGNYIQPPTVLRNLLTAWLDWVRILSTRSE